jgi:transposase
MLIMFIFIFGITEIIYVDECGVNAYYQRGYGRAKIGVRVQDIKRGQKFKRTNVIAGLWGKKHIAVQCYSHSTTAAFFEDWFEFELLAIIPENALVILDNASFHSKKHLFNIADRYDINLLFLPTYSPDLNPIEKSWANFKSWLCDNLKRFSCLDFAAQAYFYDYCS